VSSPAAWPVADVLVPTALPGAEEFDLFHWMGPHVSSPLGFQSIMMGKPGCPEQQPWPGPVIHGPLATDMQNRGRSGMELASQGQGN
jgi:hypothetical protein